MTSLTIGVLRNTIAKGYLSIVYVIPHPNTAIAVANWAATIRRKLVGLVSGETFDVSFEHNNLRTRMKHFCLEIILTCPNMKSN